MLDQLPLLPDDPEADRLRKYIVRLRKWDLRGYDVNDPRQYEVVAEMLRQPMPRSIRTGR